MCAVNDSDSERKVVIVVSEQPPSHLQGILGDEQGFNFIFCTTEVEVESALLALDWSVAVEVWTVGQIVSQPLAWLIDRAEHLGMTPRRH